MLRSQTLKSSAAARMQLSTTIFQFWLKDSSLHKTELKHLDIWIKASRYMDKASRYMEFILKRSFMHTYVNQVVSNL